MIHSYLNKTSWLGGRYGVLLLSLVVCLLFAGIWTYQILQGKNRAIAQAQANTTNFVHILEKANNRTLQAIDLTLNNVEFAVQHGRWDEDYDANTYLRSLLYEAPQVREIAFADRKGKITFTSRREIPDNLNIKEESYFTKALEGTLPPFFISSPRPGRLLGDDALNGQWHFIMTRTVLSHNGDFAGVAIAVINPGFFQELIYALEIGKNSYVSYYLYDGTLLMTSDSTSLDHDEANPANDLIFNQYLPKKEWNTFLHVQQSETSTPFIISYRATSRWPVLVAVGLNLDEVLAPWQQDIRDFSILMATSILILFGLSFIVYRQHVSKEKIENQLVEAHHDVLTGIPSLRLCLDRLSNALIRARRERDVLAVFFIDLDGFKAVNDNHGHDAGDWVLQEVTRRLNLCVRKMDTVGRLGGDEFLIILPKINDISIVERIGHNVITSIKNPILWKEKQLFVSASVGIATHPDNGHDAEELIKKADKAMYHAKKNGKNQYKLAKQSGLKTKTFA